MKLMQINKVFKHLSVLSDDSLSFIIQTLGQLRGLRELG